MNPPEALILAGPNGAGKTTSSAVLVPDGIRFLNGDIAAARLLDEGHPTAGVEIAAGRVILGELREALGARESFCVETNLAGRGLVRRINEWRGMGYKLHLVFTALDSPDLAVQRVAFRAALGGHDVPEAVVLRRWAAGLRSLFDLYLPIVDRWVVFDSSDSQLRELAEGNRESSMRRTVDAERWKRFLRLAALACASAAGPGGEFFNPVAPVHDDREP